MPRKTRAFANAKTTPRPLSDADWLASNFPGGREMLITPKSGEESRTTLAETRLMIPEADVTPDTLAGMHRIELARRTWADTHFEAKEPHLRYTPFTGPRFQPPTPGYARRKARFAQR
ncbi:hypothetical protein ABIF00_005555 [Bradyrhizobium elkanii]